MAQAHTLYHLLPISVVWWAGYAEKWEGEAVRGDER